MSTLVLQIIIKQWDKSQQSEQYTASRAEVPNQYQVTSPPAFFAFNKQCIIDQHGDDLLGNRLHYSRAEDGRIVFDRFQICLDSKIVEYQSPQSNAQKKVGSLDNGWIQADYHWRYKVYQGGFYYWLYEEVTVNLISLGHINDTPFLNADPDIIFSD